MAVLPYNYRDGVDPADQLDEDRLVGNAQTGPVRPMGEAGPAPYQPNDPQRAGMAPSDRQTTQPVQPAQPARTFSQMQAEGVARPPAPAPMRVGPPTAQPLVAAGPGAMVTSTAPNAADGYYDRNRESGEVTALSPEDYQKRQQQSLMDGVDTTFRGTASGPGGSSTYNPTFDRWYDPSLIPQGMSPDQFFGNPENVGSGSAGPVAWADKVNGQLAGAPGGGIDPLQGNPVSQAPVLYGASNGMAPTGGTSSPVPTGTGARVGPSGMSGAAGVPSGAPATTNNPNADDILSLLLGGANGGGLGGNLRQATSQAAMDNLSSPSPYGMKEVQDAYGWLGGQIDDEYALKQGNLDEEMARRGLGVSTNKAGRLNDLNIGKRDAKTTMGYNLAQDYAKTLGDYRNNAIGTANNVGTTAQNNQLSWLDRLVNFGQQGFENDMAAESMNQRADESYQDFILRMMGMGYGGSN